MRQRQVLILEGDGRLADGLRRCAQAQAWNLREIRQLRVCLGLLPQGEGTVLVLRVGRDLVREMTLLEQVVWLFPQTAVVVVADADSPTIIQLAWDLGARFVLSPAQVREELAEVIEGLLADRPTAVAEGR
jgi:DNA-binding NarL/FixJ family response regulator